MSSTAVTLVVEDDADAFDWIRRRLKIYGFNVAWARTLAEGKAALEGAGEHIFCCLILDLMLPDGSGVEILRHVRERALPVKLAVVSGTDDNTTLSDALLWKPDAFFKKPIDFIELLTWLQSVCPSCDTQTPIDSSAPQPSAGQRCS